MCHHVLRNIAVPGRFDVDHVLVGPGGIFVIETKTASKPMRGDVRVKYDGEKVTVNGFAPDRDPVFQAKALTAWVSELVAKETGKRVSLVALYSILVGLLTNSRAAAKCGS
jgi:hypothetical protein